MNQIFDLHVLFLPPLFLTISVPIRMLSKHNRCPFPQNFFLFLISAIIGFVIAVVPYLSSLYIGWHFISAQDILTIFIPALIFATIYRMDFCIFLRCLTQVYIICFLLVVLNTLVLGVVLREILHPEWPRTMGWLAALTTIPIQPSNIILMLKELSKYKYLGTMLEAEAIVSYMMVNTIFELLIGIHDDAFNVWYQYILFFLRFLLISLIYGCLMGKISAALICWLYNDPLSALCVSISVSYLTYTSAEYLFSTSGAISTTCMACIIASEKHRFSVEVDKSIYNFWGTLSYMMEIAVLMLVTVEMTRNLAAFVRPRDTYATVITYFSANILRLITFCVIGFMIRKMTYNINTKCLIVLGWSGIKGSINCLLCLILLANPSTSKNAQSFFIEIMVYSFLSLLINSTSMKLTLQLIGLSELSPTRKSNMNNCLRFIMEKRLCIINILKLNRYLSDANWSLVRTETVMQHPYKLKEYELDEEDNDFMWNGTNVVCPDCFRDVPFDISEKEFSELMKDSQMKILKAKKVSIIRQYESGIVNKNVLQVLVHTFEIMIESDIKPNIIELKMYTKRNIFLHFLYKCFKYFNEEKIPKVPENHFNRMCYYLVMNDFYDYVLTLFVLIYTTFVITAPRNYLSFFFHVFFWVWFLLEFFLKLFAYSRKHSVAIYEFCKKLWNVIDFLLLWLDFATIIVLTKYYAPYYIEYLVALRYIRIFYHLKMFLPKLLNLIEYRVDSRICFAYDLATALVNCCEEILEIIQIIIDIRAIRDIFQKQIEDERNILVKEMEQVQKMRPWIAITIKTKQAIRTTLNAMETALNELKISGFVDNIEYAFIFKEIFEKQKFLRNMKFVQPSPPKVIFSEIPWMDGDERIIEYLYDHAQAVKWDAGDVVCQERTFSKGIYIIISGLLRLKYTPNEEVINAIHTLGQIPVIDYISTTNFESKIHDNIMSGNSVGELSVLTNRLYNCSITADTASEAFFLTTEVIQNAMQLNKDPINGLEARMWKCTMINLAVAVLMDVPVYQTFTQEQIKLKLERAFMPNLKCYKIFVVTDMMDDIILIEGTVADFNNHDMYIAPILIPRNIQKLILPRSSLMDGSRIVETKLMIIPMGEAKEYEIMENEEEVAELVSITSSSCVLHKLRSLNDRLEIIKRQASSIVRNRASATNRILSVPSEVIVESYTEAKEMRIEKLDCDMQEEEERKSSTSSVEETGIYLLQNKRLDREEFGNDL